MAAVEEESHNGGINVDDDEGDDLGVPRWLEQRPPSMTDAYGVIAKPILVYGPGPMLRGRLTGGWKGRPVTAMVETGRLESVLWRIPENGTTMDAFQRELGSPHAHAWIYPVGLPWFIGHVKLPTELLLFLARQCKLELEDAISEASDVVRGVLAQFAPTDRLTVQPATLMQVDATGKEARQRTVQLYETAIETRWSVSGFSINCACDKPGGLQCLSCARVLEELINEAIGGEKFARVQFVSTTNGLTQQSTWAASGAAFHWLTRTKAEKLPEEFLGHICVIAHE